MIAVGVDVGKTLPWQSAQASSLVRGSIPDALRILP